MNNHIISLVFLTASVVVFAEGKNGPLVARAVDLMPELGLVPPASANSPEKVQTVLDENNFTSFSMVAMEFHALGTFVRQKPNRLNAGYLINDIKATNPRQEKEDCLSKDARNDNKAAYSVASFAQGNSMLTKQETISYINRLLQKPIGYKCIHIGCTKREASIVTISFTEEEGLGVKLMYTTDESKRPCYCCWESSTVIDKFDPSYIKSVELNEKYSDPPIYRCVVKFIRKGLVQRKRDTRSYSMDEVDLYFLMAESNDFEKLKKALYHLRDLCKAEEDPFGE